MASRIGGMPVGTGIEVLLKNKQKIRGARGAVADAGFTLVDAKGNERQIAFDDVASVKQSTHQSHVTRNVLIGVGIGLGAAAITLAILLRCGPLGCGNY